MRQGDHEGRALAAKLRDRDLKDELLRMIEWDHQLPATTDLCTRLAIRTAQRLGASAFDHRKGQCELHSVLESSRR